MFFLSIIITGCAGKEGSKGLITVSPASTVVTMENSAQFSVSPEGTSVTWSIKDVSGKTVGTVNSDGLYKAPSDPVNSPEKVTIVATDSSGSKGSATAFLTTFNGNKWVSTNNVAGKGSADTYSSGQKGIAVFKDLSEQVNIYIVWAGADDSLGVSHIWFSKSTDNGANFSTPVRVAGALAGKQISPSIAVDNSGKAYIVWEDYSEGDADILMSTYDGNNFGAIKKINTDIGGSLDYDSTPSIVVSNSSDICIVWEHREASSDNYPDIYFARSTDFSAPVVVTYNSGRRPSIAVDSAGIAYVVWEDLTGFPDPRFQTHIMMSRVDINNIIHPNTEPLNSLIGTNYHARFPSVTVAPDGKKVYVVWQRAEIKSPGFENETISSYDIDLAVDNVDTGNVTNYPSIPHSDYPGHFGGFAYPSLASDDNNIYIVWDDQRNGDTSDIYFSKSSDNGKTFSTDRIVNDETGTWHKKPSIAVSGGKAYVTWTDFRNTSGDVFFARE